MSRATLSLLLSVVSLGAVVALHVKLDGLEKRLTTQRTGRADAVEPENRARASSARDLYPPAEREDAGPDVVRASPEAGDGAPVTRAEVDDRIGKLERRLEKLAPKRRTPVRFPEQLARMLELSRTQEAQVASLVEDGRLRVEQLLRTPGRDGTSPYDRRETLYGMVRESIRTGNWDETKPALVNARLREEPIPGRETTYGNEVDRLVRETRDAIANTLTEEQRDRFESVEIAPMVNDGGLAPREIYGAVAATVSADQAAGK